MASSRFANSWLAGRHLRQLPRVRNAVRHVLRDIDDGLIGVGSRTTRGLGTLRLAEPLGAVEPVVIDRLEPTRAGEASP